MPEGTTPAMTEADAFLAQSDADLAAALGLPVADPAAPAADAGSPAPAADEAVHLLEDDAPEAGTVPPPPGAGEDPTLPGTPAASTPSAEPAAPAKPKDFVVFDAEGELEIPEGIQIQFTAAKGVQKLPLDRVVRLAQSGYYNEQLHEEVKQARTMVPQMEQRVAEAEAAAREAAARLEKLLTDEETYYAEKERLERQNTPEERAKRAEQELRQRQAMEAKQAEFQQAQAFLGQQLEPVLAQMMEQYPKVTFEEVYGRFMLNIAPHQVSGRVPPSRFQQVMSMVRDDLGPWMAQLHDQRVQADAQQDTATARAARKAQEEAQQAKRQLARRLKPTGRTPAAVVAGTTGTPANASQAMDQVLAQVAGSLRVGS